MNNKNGESAFPVFEGDMNVNNGTFIGYTCGGMTLRDYFAGQALAGMCYKADWYDGEENVLARWAYDIADAMLAERERKPDA